MATTIARFLRWAFPTFRDPTCVEATTSSRKVVSEESDGTVLPHSRIYRLKAGFRSPLRSWVRCDLIPLIDKVFNEPALRRRRVFAPAVASALIESNRARYSDAKYTVFSKVYVELRMQILLNKAKPTPIEDLPGTP